MWALLCDVTGYRRAPRTAGPGSLKERLYGNSVPVLHNTHDDTHGESVVVSVTSNDEAIGARRVREYDAVLVSDRGLVSVGALAALRGNEVGEHLLYHRAARIGFYDGCVYVLNRVTYANDNIRFHVLILRLDTRRTVPQRGATRDALLRGRIWCHTNATLV